MSALGSLVVKLGLEYAQYTTGLDKSEQAALAAAKKIQDTFDGMKAKVAATAGAVAGGLAAGFTIAAFKGIISGAIDTGAALDDLRMQTGATVEALSGLVAVGKFNNMGPEQIGAAMNKLSANLASATEEGKGAGKALEALGIDFDKFKLMRPEEQMQTVAKAMAGFEDGTGKAAVAMALYGKQGAQMLPFLHDLAEVGELQAKVTTEQAAAAANLDDNLARLSTSGEGWKKELANGMIPALDLGAQALVDMMNGSGGLREEVRRLVADGSIKQWTTDAIKGLSYVADVGQIAWRVLQSIGKGLGGLAAALVQALSGDFRSAWDTLQALGQDMIDVFDGPTVGARFRESLDKVAASAAATGDAAAKARPSLDGFANTTDKAGKTAKEAKDPFDALRESIIKATAAYQAEAVAGEKLTEGQKKAIDVLDQLRTGKVKVTEAQAIQIGKDIEAMLAAEGENKAREEFIKTADAERAARMKTVQAMEQAAASVEEQNRALRDEIELIGLTDAAQLRVLQQRNEAIILTKEATLAELERASAITGTMTREQIALQAEIEALRERNQLLGARYDKTVVAKAAQEAAGEWTKFTDSVYNGLSDSLYRGFEAGKGFFKSFWDGIKNTAKTTVLKFGVQGIMTGVSGFLGLGSSAANAATSGASTLGGIGNLASLGTNLFSSGLGSTISGAIGSGVGALLGTTAGNAALGTSLGLGAGSATAAAAAAAQAGGASAAAAASAASAGASIAAAIPYIGVAIAALSLLTKKSTPHTGGIGAYSADSGATTGASVGLAFGIDQKHYTQAGEELSTNVAKGIVQILDSTAATFGKQAGYYAATAFADDSSKDGAWGALRIKFGEKVLLDWADTAVRDANVPREFADGEAGQKQYLAAVAADVRVALDSIGLPAWATGMLDKLEQGASIEQIAGVVDQINSAKAAFASFAQYMPSFVNAADSAIDKLVAASGGVQALVGNMSTFVDRFYTDAEKLAVNTDNVRAAMSALGFEMPTTRDGFKALVQAQIALGDAGAKGLAGLLAVSGAFDAIMEASANTADTAADIASKQAEQRDKDYQALERAVSAEKKRLQVQIDVARDIASTAGDLFSLLHDNVRELYGEVDATRASQAQRGSDFIAKALETARASGYLPDADKLAEAISDVRAGLDASNFANAEERNYAALVLAGQLSGLEEVAGKQLTDAQRTVRELEVQTEQLEMTLDYWRDLIAISNGNYQATLSLTEAIEAMRRDTVQNGTTKPGSVNTVGGGTTPEAGRGVVPRAAYGAYEALGSFEKFKAWYNGIRSNADPKVFMDQGYQVPDWMRIHNGADDGTDKEQFGSYLFFKNNPQYAKDFEQIYSTGRSSFATDGSTLVRSDLSKMPAEVADYYKGNRDALLMTEGFGLDPVLAYQLYNFGPGQFGLDQKKQSFTEWLQNTKWTPDGLVANNNVVALAQLNYPNYKLPRWDTSTGNIVDLDGRMYTPDGKYIGNASRAQLEAIYGAGYVATNGGQSSLYNSQVGGGASEDDYYGAIKTNLDQAIAAGWTAQQLVDAVVTTGASMRDVATAYGISMSQLEENLRAGGATNIPGFAGGGSHIGGLRIVGERGWELEATGPSRIWNQKQLASALGSGDTSRYELLVQALMEEIKQLRAAVSTGTGYAGDVAKLLASVKNGNAFMTTAAPTF